MQLLLSDMVVVDAAVVVVDVVVVVKVVVVTRVVVIETVGEVIVKTKCEEGVVVVETMEGEEGLNVKMISSSTSHLLPPIYPTYQAIITETKTKNLVFCERVLKKTKRPTD